MAVILLIHAKEGGDDHLAQFLRSNGHDVIVSDDRWEAVRLSSSLAIDVALVDFAHPAMNGIEVVLQIRKSAPGAAIVALSPDAHEANYGLLRLASSAGATMVLHKPANTEDILKVVETVLRNRSSAP